MRLSQLKYFLAVCKYGSFTQAANEFFVTQPAVSSAIRDLEEEYGVQLLSRKKKHLELTEEGLWLKKRAEFILNYVAATDEQMHVFSKSKQYLRLGVAPLLGTLFFFSIYNDFGLDHPDIHVDVLEAGSIQIQSWVEDGIVDMGVSLLDGLSEEHFQLIKLFETELVFCVHESHPLAARREISVPELAREKLILLKEDSYQNQLIKKKFSVCGQTLDILMYSSQLSSIFNILQFGNCGAFLFKQLVNDKDEFRAISMEPPIKLSVGLVRRKDQMMYPYTQKLISYTKKCSKSA